MERKIKQINKNKVAVSKIPSRPSMYDIIDMCVGGREIYDCASVKEIRFLAPTGQMLTLDEMREERNIEYDHMRPTYPVDTLSLRFPDFHLTYNTNKGYFDKWEWVFDFRKGEIETDNKMERVNSIIDVID